MAFSFSFSFSVQPQLLHSADSPFAAGRGRRRRHLLPDVICPCGLYEPAAASSSFGAVLISSDFDFQKGIESVQALLHRHQRRWRRGEERSRPEMLTTVDHLKRLCIDHYFQDEIHGGAIQSCIDNLIQSDHLLDAALSFRFIREAGHHVSADEVLGRFIDDDINSGDFSLCHSKDIGGLLSLQDTSHLNMGSEISLYRAKEFCSRHLRSAIKCMQIHDPNLARHVRHSLDHPYHVSLPQYKAMHHLGYIQRQPTCTRNNTMIMEDLALAEFHLNKLLHQTEIQDIKRWWVNLGLAQEISAARDQVMKWYMWAMTVIQGHSFSRCRIETTKLISFVYVVDDIFDLVATQEELILFAKAVKMWDLETGDSLPGYMKSCYSALYTVTNDIADMVKKEHGSNPIDHLKKAWAMLFDAFLLEAKWLSTNQVPGSEDYLKNGVVTSGVPLVFLHIFFMLGGDDVGKLTYMDPIITCPAKILRLWDDMGTAKDEAQEGIDGSYKELYLEENPHCSSSDADNHILGLIATEWEELNRVCFSNKSFSPSFVQVSLNLARMVGVMYGYDQEQRLPVLEDYTRMFLF